MRKVAAYRRREERHRRVKLQDFFVFFDRERRGNVAQKLNVSACVCEEEEEEDEEEG